MARKRPRRFQRGSDDQQQLEDIEKAQQAARRKKTTKIIDSIAKSERRLRNRLEQITNPEEAREQFGP